MMPAPHADSTEPSAADALALRTPRSEMLMKMTLENMEELHATIRIILDCADKTADTLRAWIRLVEDELDRKGGF